MYISLEPPDQYAVVRRHNDFAGVMDTWGPFASEGEAQAAIEGLQTLGLTAGVWETYPLRPVKE